MINEPMDVDQFWPNVRTRDEALDAIQGLLSASDAETVWNGFLLPLYDLMKAQHLYPGGRCRCGAVHPSRSFGPSDRSRRHRMWCQRYVGPLTHRRSSAQNASFHGFDMASCMCGRRYPYWVDIGVEHPVPAECPDRLITWRGPRPHPNEEVRVSDEQETVEQEDTATAGESENVVELEDGEGGSDQDAEDETSEEGESFNA